jgi:hypothetical protein
MGIIVYLGVSRIVNIDAATIYAASINATYQKIGSVNQDGIVAAAVDSLSIVTSPALVLGNQVSQKRK